MSSPASRREPDFSSPPSSPSSFVRGGFFLFPAVGRVVAFLVLAQLSAISIETSMSRTARAKALLVVEGFSSRLSRLVAGALLDPVAPQIDDLLGFFGAARPVSFSRTRGRVLPQGGASAWSVTLARLARVNLSSSIEQDCRPRPPWRGHRWLPTRACSTASRRRVPGDRRGPVGVWRRMSWQAVRKDMESPSPRAIARSPRSACAQFGSRAVCRPARRSWRKFTSNWLSRKSRMRRSAALKACVEPCRLRSRVVPGCMPIRHGAVRTRLAAIQAGIRKGAAVIEIGTTNVSFAPHLALVGKSAEGKAES